MSTLLEQCLSHRKYDMTSYLRPFTKSGRNISEKSTFHVDIKFEIHVGFSTCGAREPKMILSRSEADSKIGLYCQ